MLEKRRAYHRGKKVWYFALLAREETVAVIYDQWMNLKHPWQIRDPVRLNSSAFFVPRPQVSTSPIEATPPNSLPRTTGKFTALYSSVRSLLSKIDHLRITVVNLLPHIICLTETWLSSNISDAEVFI